MSDSASVTSSGGEPKTRITRSSLGQASVSSSATEALKQEENDRSLSPANSRSSVGKSQSRTGTPTQEPSPIIDQPVVSTENTPTVPPLTIKRKMGIGVVATPTPPRRNTRSSNKLNTDEDSDTYCWICRKDGIVVPCQLCPRVYHMKCLGLPGGLKEDWTCVECEKVMRSECEDTKPKALASLSMDHLITCLQYALERMKVPNSEVFQVPVDPAMEPEYHNIIVHPMDMSTLDKNVKKKVYGSTEAFLADAKWILHNSILYNGMHNKYTMTAKTVLKVCRNQMMEIETCPDCFLASCTQENSWFCKPCRYSHPLVWAKLKGYPFWPAKALREVDGQVDCRFFGAHDKAWVPTNQVFMLSAEPPAPVKNKKGSGFDEAMAELEKYVSKHKAKYGTFTYASIKEPYKADFGMLSPAAAALETKKRKLAEANSNEAPVNKKPATSENTPSEEPGKYRSLQKHLSMAFSKLSGASNKAIETVKVNGSAAQTPELKNEMPETTIDEAAQSVKEEEEKPVIKKEPEKPGVFTVSDELLAKAADTEFSVMKDDHIRQPKTNALVSKIEDSLQSNSAGDGQTETMATSNIESKPKEADKEPIHETAPAAAVITATVTAERPSEEAMDTSIPSTSDDRSDKPAPVIKFNDEQYSQKLKKTIDSCKEKIDPKAEGDKREASADEGSDDDSSSSDDSEYEEFVRRRRYARYKQTVALDSLSDKETAVAMQLVKLMKDGLESTIKDVVKQTLTGQVTIQSTPSSSTTTSDIKTSNTTSPDKTTINNKTSPLVNGVMSSSPNKSSSKSDTSQTDKSTKSAPAVSSETAGAQQQEKEKTTAAVTVAEPVTDISSSDAPVSSELVEKLNWKHKCEIEAVKHNAELAAMEMRKSIELEKERALWRLRKQLEHKFKKIIEETKKKQWCAMCGKEAIFYCCWNTSYCDYPCQQKHWPSHLKTCAQIAKDEGGGDKKSGSSQTPSSASGSERGGPQAAHSNSAPPPYSSASGDMPPTQYLMPGPVQYMPVQTNAGPVYQAQLPVQAMPMQSGPRGQVSPATGAPMLYPVMPPPAQGPPQPQSYMLSQRQPYRLAPKYS